MLKRLLRHKGIWLLAAALSLTLILSVLVYFGQGRAGLLGDFSNAMLAPLQRAGAAVSRNVSHLYGEAARYEALRLENEALHRELAAAQTAAREGLLAVQENERLYALLGFVRTKQNLTLQPCKVQSESPDNWSARLRIDQGSEAGAALGDCVLDADGNLVGRVSTLGARHCELTLLSDPGASFSVQAQDCLERGVLRGDIGLLPDGLLRLSYLPKDTQVRVGEAILSQANEGQYPDGLLLGYVERITPDAGGLSSEAIVRPAADLSLLRQLFLVTDF